MFFSHLFCTASSLDVPTVVTQEEGHTGFLIHLLSAVRALTFLARRIQLILSLVDREVEVCLCNNDIIVLHLLGIFIFIFIFIFIEAVQLTSSRVIVEMVADGGGHFSPASYRWFTHMSLLFSTHTAHIRAVGTPHTITNTERHT